MIRCLLLFDVKLLGAVEIGGLGVVVGERSLDHPLLVRVVNERDLLYDGLSQTRRHLQFSL